MSNRTGICWKCIHMDNCKAFNKDRNKTVTECGRFHMKEAEQAIHMKEAEQAILQILHDNFFGDGGDRKCGRSNKGKRGG